MPKQYCFKGLVSLLSAIIMMGFCQPTWAAGFALKEASARQMGTAYAGSASIADDASTNFYNSAGLTHLRREQIVFSAIGILAQSKLTANSTTATLPVGFPPGGVPVPAGAPGSHTRPRAQALIPAIHYAKRLDEGWVFGFSLDAPFGLSNIYKNNSIARYMATRTDLVTADFAPSLAYCFGYGFSIGVGVDAIYTKANLNARINSLADPTVNPMNDGYQENTADGWGVGFHIGALWAFDECTRLGANYRSYAKERLRGESATLIPVISPIETLQSVKGTVSLPETVTLSAYHAFNYHWALMGDVEWTRWDRFKQLKLRFQNGSTTTTPEFFRNAIRVAVGASFRANDCWQWRIGTAYDETPTQDLYRTVRIPDQNRMWATLGAQYRFSKCLALDVSYAHLFVKKANLNESAPMSTPLTNQTIQHLQGRSRTFADLIGIQLTWDIV